MFIVSIFKKCMRKMYANNSDNRMLQKAEPYEYLQMLNCLYIFSFPVCSQHGKFNFLTIMISFVLRGFFRTVLSLTYISKQEQQAYVSACRSYPLDDT